MDTPWSRARFAEARVARLATADGSGRPHQVPFVFVVIGDSIYSVIDAKPKTDPGARLRRVANIMANPRVSALVDHYEDDWSRLWWVRADGTARIIDASDAEAAGPIAALIARYPQYQVVRPPGPVIAIAVERWSGWSAAG